MSDEEESKTGLKFKDRRRFDPSGNLRDQGATEEINADPGVNHLKKTVDLKTSAVADQAPDASEPELNFASFMVSLATQALIQLGEISPPPGMDLPVNRAAAKQTIDILEMLKTKTKGNLDSSETKLIDEILYNVRMAFVKVQG